MRGRWLERSAVGCALALAALAGVAAPVDANTGTVAELEQVAGIGPALAARIIEQRDKRPFEDWRDLIGRVGGIGRSSAAKFSAAGLTVNGVGFDRAAATPK